MFLGDPAPKNSLKFIQLEFIFTISQTIKPMFMGRNRNRRKNTFPKVTGDVIPHANNESPGNEIWMVSTMSTCWAHATRMWSNLTLLDTRRGEFRRNVSETRQPEKRIQYFLSSFFFSLYHRIRLERATFLSPPPCSPFALHNLWPTQKKKGDCSNTTWIILLVPRVWGLTRKWYSGRRWSLLAEMTWERSRKPGNDFAFTSVNEQGTLLSSWNPHASNYVLFWKHFFAFGLTLHFLKVKGVRNDHSNANKPQCIKQFSNDRRK